MSVDLPQVWPQQDLEVLGCCPVCASSARELVHEDVMDRLFGSAPGKWQVYRCETCQSSYVDPRPTPASIGRAYAKYFTHEKGDSGGSSSPSAGIGHLVKTFMNAYRNARWGMKLTPAHPWRWLSWLLTLPLHGLVIANMRQLPKRAPFIGAKLLDVGCGNGDFLVMARAAGWDVQGIDFDPKAVESAHAKGLAVDVGGLDQLRALTDRFDYITCSHVLEHVHSPQQWLLALRDLLRPDGALWLQTPNTQSRGHNRFGQNWRGLEPPRHLVIFAPESLLSLTSISGLQAQLLALPVIQAFLVYSESVALSKGTLDPKAGYKFKSWFDFRSWWDACAQALSLEGAEFITIVAKRVD